MSSLSSSNSTLLALVSSIVFITAIWIAKSLATRGRARLPPGPPPAPLIGNALQMPSSFSWLYYTELSKTYGDVLHLSALGQHIIVLSSIEATTDLLVKRATTFSGRPYLAMAGDIIGWHSSFVFISPGPAWKGQRKLVHQFLGAPAMPLYHPILEANAYELVQRLVTDKKSFTTEVTYATAKLVMRVGYGVKVDSPEHVMSRLSREASEHIEIALEIGNFPLVNIFPVLRHIPLWFPFAHFRRIGATWREHLNTTVNMPFDRVKADMAMGVAEPSFCTRSIEDRSADITDDHIKWAAASLHVASANTTLGTMGTFLLAMIMHPEVQAKAQAEIDRVVGTDRLPKLSDRERLPYLDCVFKEVLRWHPAAPTALPHLTTEASEYRGWYIPKDTTIIPNVWALSRDPKVYHYADKFIPERYEDNPNLLDPRSYFFGFGRRVCPGQAFAEQNMWIMMATLLSTVHMQHALDENGAEIEVHEEFTGLFLTGPVPFPHRIQPRSSHLMTLLTESCESR